MSSQGPSSTSTTSVPDWLSQYGQPFMQAAAQAAQTPYSPYTGPRVADLSPLQNQALSGYGAVANYASPLYGTAANTLQSQLSGNMNPFTQDVVDRTTRQATDAYAQAVGQTSGRFNSPGNWDSARHDMRDELNQRALATGLGDSIGSLNSAGYENAQNRAQSAIGALNSTVNTGTGALGNALQAGNVPRQQLQDVYNTGYSDYQDQRNYPWSQLQNFAGLLNGGRSAAGSSTTSQQGYDPVSQGLGVAALGSQMGSKGGNGTSGSTKGGS